MQRFCTHAARNALTGSTLGHTGWTGFFAQGSQRIVLHSLLSRQVSQARLVAEGSLGQQSQHSFCGVMTQSASAAQVVSPTRAVEGGLAEGAGAEVERRGDVEAVAAAGGGVDAARDGDAAAEVEESAVGAAGPGALVSTVGAGEGSGGTSGAPQAKGRSAGRSSRERRLGARAWCMGGGDSVIRVARRRGVRGVMREVNRAVGEQLA